MKYRITDNQSGKTLVINGDAPPSEQEAEQLFQESGIRNGKQEKQSFDVMKYIQESAQKGAQLSLAGGGPIPTFLGGTPGQKAVAVAGPVIGATGLGVGALMSYLNPQNIANLQKEAENKVKNFDISSTIEAGNEYVKRHPEATDQWNTVKQGLENIKGNVGQLNRTISEWGPQTYTTSGETRSKAESMLYRVLSQAGRSAIKQQAPDVAKYTDRFRFILKDLPQGLSAAQKASWLLLKLTGAKTLMGL